ncbi:MAG: LysR family transcriptional regulator, partial [Acinetobacter sp.]
FRAGLIKVTPIVDPAFSRVITLAMHSTRNIPKHIRIISREIVECVEQSIEQKKWPKAEWIYKS